MVSVVSDEQSGLPIAKKNLVFPVQFSRDFLVTSTLKCIDYDFHGLKIVIWV